MATETIETVAHDDTPNREIHEQLGRKYSAGFITEIESDSLPPGLDEDTIRALSAKKEEPEWMTQWRLDAYRHFLTMPMPNWAKLQIAPIDLQALSYYSAPKGPKYASLDDVPKELLDTYDKLGVPLHERAKLAGVAVDAVFDSVSVGTTFRRGHQGTPGAGAPVPGHRGSGGRQLLRRAQLGGVLRWQLRVHSQGRALPDGTEHLLPHQRRPHRPVRAHPHRVRGQGLRVLPGRLHRADAR